MEGENNIKWIVYLIILCDCTKEKIIPKLSDKRRKEQNKWHIVESYNLLVRICVILFSLFTFNVNIVGLRFLYIFMKY